LALNQEEWVKKWSEEAPHLPDDVLEDILTLFGIRTVKAKQGPLPERQGPKRQCQ
jgi:hypothetical protein